MIAAYRDLPPPIKELIDWDQQRIDVAVKYEQVVEQFSTISPQAPLSLPLPETLAGAIEIQNLRVRAASGEPVLEGINASIPLGTHFALLGLSGEGADVLAKVIGRRITTYEGVVRVASIDLSALDEAATGLRMAYFGPEATLFGGTIRDNVLYSLRRPRRDNLARLPGLDDIVRPEDALAQDAEGAGALWTDYAAAGAHGADDIDDAVVEVLDIVGMSETVYRLGLGRRLDPLRDAELAGRFVEMRAALNAELAQEHAAALIEPLDPDRFNRNATLGENLLFGVLRESGASEAALFADADIRAVLDAEGLTHDLADAGLTIAATMVEIFSDLSADHFLFERFSFIAADELPDFNDIVTRAASGGLGGLAQIDRSRLMTLALAYTEPRHRLGLVTPDLTNRVVRARLALRRRLPTALAEAVEFYDPARYCVAAPLRDNLLFGRIDQSVAGATERVLATLHRLLHRSGLERDVYRIGLDFRTGPAGRLLSPTQRSAVALARCLVKRPSILVLDEPLAVFGEIEGRAIITKIRRRMKGATMIVAMRDRETAQSFDHMLSFAGGRLRMPTPEAELAGLDGEGSPEPDKPEIEALRAVPMFSTVDTTRLKLIAFTSERVSFAAGQQLFRQGDPSDTAYVILDGTAEVRLETSAGSLPIATLGAHSTVGEMGVVTGSPRSATVVANTSVNAIELSKDIVLGLIGEFPQIALAMLRDQIRRTALVDARLAKAASLGRVVEGQTK